MPLKRRKFLLRQKLSVHRFEGGNEEDEDEEEEEEEEEEEGRRRRVILNVNMNRKDTNNN
jgi:hypothetical protein